jgi:hypothetical protein
MGKASSSKKVARAARAGGGRRRGRTRRNLLFPGTLATVIVLGIALVAYGATQEGEAAAAPTLQDHWHAAYGVFVCDKFQPPFADGQPPDPLGIHTHQDGLVHIHPTSSSATGDKATLGKFADDVHMTLENDKIELPDGTTYEEGDNKCDGDDATVRIARWTSANDDKPDILTGEFDDIHFTRDGEVFTIAFAPSDTELEKPPSVAELAAPSDLQPGGGSVPPGGSVPGSVPPGGSVPGSVPPGGSVPGSVPGGSTPSTPAGSTPTTSGGTGSTATTAP